MDFVKELKLLSNSADKIITKSGDGGRLRQWFAIINEKAVGIVNDSSKIDTSSAGCSTGTITVTEQGVAIPDCVSFVRSESAKETTKMQRISALFPQMKKDHVQHVQVNSVKNISASSVPSTSLQVLPSNQQIERVFLSESSTNKDVLKLILTPLKLGTKEGYFHPPYSDDKQLIYTEKDECKNAVDLEKRKSSKRKSSFLELSKTDASVVTKKVKTFHGEDQQKQKERKLRKSTKRGIQQVKQLSESAKISVQNSSILKENRMQQRNCVQKTDLNQNAKKVLNHRQLKIEENKKKREEKVQKGQQVRLKLAKDREDRLRVRKGGANDTVSSTRIVLEPKKKTRTKTPEIETPSMVSSSEVKQVLKYTKASTYGTPTLPSSSLKSKVACLKVEEKNQQSKRETGEKKTHELNKTFLALDTPANKKVQKVPLLAASKDSQILKTVATTSGKSVYVENIPSNNPVKSAQPKLKQMERGAKISSIAASTSTQSYEITPSRSSLKSYDISEINDDSDDDEAKGYDKPIPGWATGVRLRNALVQQQYSPINTDELFGNVFPSTDLAGIMGVKKKVYSKRTSSAIWNSPSFS